MEIGFGRCPGRLLNAKSRSSSTIRGLEVLGAGHLAPRGQPFIANAPATATRNETRFGLLTERS